MVNCPNCGMDAGESKFCPNCGTKIEVVEKSGSICPNCGTDAGESNFCPNCGTKIVQDNPSSICPNCGTDAGESNFCPNCGTKIGEESVPVCPSCGEEVANSSFCPKCGTKIGDETPENTCPSCGKSLNENAKFCPYCGWSDSRVESKSSLDKLIDVDDKISGKFSKFMKKSKSVDVIMDKSASIRYNHFSEFDEKRIKYYEDIEPVFVEVFNSINDDFVKTILLLERNQMTNSGSVVGMAASHIYTPTKDMPHDDAVKFYQDMANRIFAEINAEKQKGTFDEETFYKQKVKDSSIENTSFLGFSKSIKAWNKNKR